MRACLLALVAVTSLARAEVTLRMAAIAPDGSPWTRELKAFARELDTRTKGRVHLKWYWGAIAGDELQVLDRIKRDQLDGEAGAQFCDRVAPSLRVMRMLGLFQSWDEALYVVARMRSTLDGEFRQSGFTGFVSGMGNDILFTRAPVRSLADLRKTRLWHWSLDNILDTQLRSLGIPTVPTDVGDAMKAYDDDKVDAFVTIPMAALSYQWSARTRYFTDLRFAFLPGCLVVANRAFDSLSVDDQRAFREVAAKLLVRFEDLGRTLDRKLVGGLFARQGLTPVPASKMFRSELFAAAEEARQHVPPALVPVSLMQKVGGWLADYRAQNHR
jgi:TRAP-type C4-dicarboxylate transport system substrate-binding protein